MPVKLLRISLLSAACQYGRSFQLWKLGGEQSADTESERAPLARARRRRERPRSAVRGGAVMTGRVHPLSAAARSPRRPGSRRPSGFSRLRSRSGTRRRAVASPRRSRDAAGALRHPAGRMNSSPGIGARRGGVPLSVHREPEARDRPLRRARLLPGETALLAGARLPVPVAPRGGVDLVRPRGGGLPPHDERRRRAVAPGVPAARGAARGAADRLVLELLPSLVESFQKLGMPEDALKCRFLEGLALVEKRRAGARPSRSSTRSARRPRSWATTSCSPTRTST